MAVSRNVPTTTQAYGESHILQRIHNIIILEESQNWLVIVWSTNILQTFAMATCLEELKFLAPVSQRLWPDVLNLVVRLCNH